MSKSLIKILDYSIFPASILIIAKFFGILLTANIFGIVWSLRDYTGSIFAVSTVLRIEDVIIMTAYSDLVMYIIVALFFSIAVFRTIFLHNTHASQTVILSLTKRNLLNIIKDTHTVYSAAGSWLIFLILSNVIIVADILNNKSFIWIGVLTISATILLCLILVIDVSREIEYIRKHPSKVVWD